MVAPSPRPPAPELLEELDELLEEDELELLDEEDELELLDELELEEDELELLEEVVPPQAVKAPIVKHNRPVLNSASGLFPETGFVMLFHLNGWILQRGWREPHLIVKQTIKSRYVKEGH